MPYDQSPQTPLSPEQAVAVVQAFVEERAASGVMMAGAITGLELDDGVLTATWSDSAIGKELSDLLLGLNPHENFAQWLGVPLSFDNEEGRQIRQHVHAVRVTGPFEVNTMSVRDLYERATGLRYDHQ